MKDENDLEMGLFGSGNELEIDLNFGEAPEDEEDDGTNPNLEPGEENPEQDNLGDDESQEGVARTGGEEDEGQLSDGKSSPNVYHDLAAVLTEQGLLTPTEETKIEDLDGLVSAFKQEIKQSEYSDLDETQKEYLDALRTGIPTEKFKEHKESQINLERITTEDIEGNEELRRRIIYQNLVNQGLSESVASKYTQRSVDNGLDVEDAAEALPAIKEYEKSQYQAEVETAKKAAVAEAKKVEKEKNDLKDAIMSPEEIFDGYKVTPNIKDAVYKEMNTVVNYKEDGTPENSLMKYRRENPVEFDAKLYYLFSLTNKFENLKRFEEKGTSSAVSNLERTLRNSQFHPSGGKPSFIEDPDSYSSGFGDEIVFD